MTALIQMISAELVGTTNTLVAYSGTVHATDFTDDDFLTQPDGVVPTAINQDGPTGISIDWSNDITDQTGITYFGSAPGYATPQTIAFT